MRRIGETGGFGRHRPGHAEDVDQQVDQQRRGDEVEHDRGDHDMAAALGLQIGRDRRPGRPEQGRAQGRGQQRDAPVRPGHRQADHGHAKPADRGLPLATDVEHPRVEGHRHRKPGEDEVGGIVERVAPARGRADGPAHHVAHGFPRAFPDVEHHQPRHDQREEQVDERDQDHIGPFRHLAHHAAPFVTPAINRPSSPSFVSPGRRSPMICPSNMTAIRSDSDRISSSSTETSRIALP